MDKEQNLKKKERKDYVWEVAQEARDTFAQFFKEFGCSGNHHCIIC